MKVTLESTSKIVTLNGVGCRIWEGKTEGGVPIHVYIALTAVDSSEDASELERDLRESKPPSAAVAAFPARLVMDY